MDLSDCINLPEFKGLSDNEKAYVNGLIRAGDIAELFFRNYIKLNENALKNPAEKLNKDFIKSTVTALKKYLTCEIIGFIEKHERS